MTRNERPDMRAFWDEKARENPMYYISSYRPYDQQDAEEFWRWGQVLTERYLTESEIPFTGQERVLEIGCGIGRLTQALARRFREVVALDVSEEMVRQAREHLAADPHVEVRLGNGVDLAGLADGSFDFVFSYLVFQHIPDPEVTRTYLRESARVLKPGGWFHFQVNGEHEPGALRTMMRSLKRAVLGGTPASAGAAPGAATATSAGSAGPRGLDSPAWRGSRLRLPEVRATCEQAGLEVLRTRGEGTQYLWVTARRRATR